MTSVLARCCRRRALGLWAGGHGTLGGPNPSRGSLVSTQTGAAYSTAAVSEPAPLGGAQPAVAVAPPTPAQQQRQQADGSQHAASQASIPVQQGTSSSAAVASSAAPAAAAGQPCTAAAAEAGAPGAAPGVAAGEPGLLARMRAAQAHGRHQLATDIFMDAGMGWGLPPAEQRAAFEAALLSCTFTRNGSRALHLARAMWKRGVPVGPAAHLSVVHAAAAGNRHREAYDYLRSIARRHLRARMFNALLTAAVGRGGRWEEWRLRSAGWPETVCEGWVGLRVGGGGGGRELGSFVGSNSMPGGCRWCAAAQRRRQQQQQCFGHWTRCWRWLQCTSVHAGSIPICA